MSNKTNDEFYETAQEWIEEDLFQTLKRARQEPGLTIKKTAEVIKEAFGDDLPYLLKAITDDLKECSTCGKLKKSNPTPRGDEICPSCGDTNMMDYEA